jgi:hypothetical protein
MLVAAWSNTGLPTSLRFVQITYGDFGNFEIVRRPRIQHGSNARIHCRRACFFQNAGALNVSADVMIA